MPRAAADALEHPAREGWAPDSSVLTSEEMPPDAIFTVSKLSSNHSF